MRVLVWRHWPLDGQLLEPGDVVEVAAIDGAEICSAGAGEPVREVDVELAVSMAPERGITRRVRKKGRR